MNTRYNHNRGRRRSGRGSAYAAQFDPQTRVLDMMSPAGRIQVDGWPNPQAVVSTSAGQRVCRPQLSIRRALQPFSWAGGVGDAEIDAAQVEFSFEPAADATAAVRSYWLSYPCSVVRQLMGFHGRHSLHLAQWCAAGGSGILQRIPVLGFMAALRSPHELTQLVELADAELARKLGFDYPCASEAVDVLRRLPAGAVSTRTVQLFRELLSPSRLSMWRLGALRQESRLNVGVLRLIHLPNAESIVEPWLIAEVAAQRAEERVGVTADKIERALHLAEVVGRCERVAFGSIEQIDKHLAELLKQVGAVRTTHDPRFPPPPIPDVVATPVRITAIRSRAALAVEGQVMAHCAGRCVSAVEEGQAYFYRMQRPERVTLRLGRSSSGHWVLQDARTYGNAEPLPAALAMIAYWLSVNQSVSADEVLPIELQQTFAGC